MQTVQDVSFGVVPLLRNADSWRVLLIHQISYRGDDFWTLPKGHAEEGENELEAAVRELKEETGISQCELDTAHVFETSYTFTHEQQIIQKTVRFWIGYCSSEVTYISHPEEIREVRWCDFASAYTLLSHENTREVLHSVETQVASLADGVIRVE